MAESDGRQANDELVERGGFSWEIARTPQVTFSRYDTTTFFVEGATQIPKQLKEVSDLAWPRCPLAQFCEYNMALNSPSSSSLHTSLKPSATSSTHVVQLHP